MLQILKTQEDKTLKEFSINEFEHGSWFNLIKPTADEIKQVANALNIDADFLRDSLDSEERSRIELDDDKLLIITNIPMMEDENSFDTLPLGVIMTPDNIEHTLNGLKNTVDWNDKGNIDDSTFIAQKESEIRFLASNDPYISSQMILFNKLHGRMPEIKLRPNGLGRFYQRLYNRTYPSGSTYEIVWE